MSSGKVGLVEWHFSTTQSLVYPARPGHCVAPGIGDRH